MGIFNFWKKDPRANHDFSDKDRELATERRRMNIELENAKKAYALEELKMEHELKMAQYAEELEELYGDDDEPGQHPMSVEDKLASKLIDEMFEKKSAQQSAPMTGAKNYTDEELKVMWEKVSPQHKIVAKSCTDAQVTEFMQKRILPDANEDSLKRALAIVRTAS